MLVAPAVRREDEVDGVGVVIGLAGRVEAVARLAELRPVVVARRVRVESDDDVEVYISKPKYFAAIKYSGYSNSKKEQNHREELIEIIQNNQLKMLSEYFVLSYDAPTKFYNRRNEILIQVDYSN